MADLNEDSDSDFISDSDAEEEIDWEERYDTVTSIFLLVFLVGWDSDLNSETANVFNNDTFQMINLLPIIGGGLRQLRLNLVR
jgi:hypothetical protein